MDLASATLICMISIPLTPEEFAALAVKAQQEQGITLTGDEGKITKMGVTAGYKYADGVLQVVVLEKPVFVSTEYCEAQLRKALGIV